MADEVNYAERFRAFQAAQSGGATPAGSISSTPGLQQSPDAQAQAISSAAGEGGAQGTYTPGSQGSEVSYAERFRDFQRLKESGVHTPSPGEADVAGRRGVLKTGLQSQGFENASVGEPGLKDYTLRAGLSAADDFAEKKTKFLSKYPDGDFVEVPDVGNGGKTLMFRMRPGEEFHEVHASVYEDWEIIGRLADLTGEIPATVGTGVAAYLTSGASLVRQVGAMMAGQLTGDAVKELWEKVRGYSRESAGEFATRAGMRAVGAGIGGAVVGKLAGPLNFARGAAAVKLMPGALEAQQAAAELGIEPLIASQIAASPILKKLGAQSAALVTNIGDYLRQQQASAVAAFASLTERDALQLASMKNIEQLHDDAIKQVLSVARANNGDLTSAGAAIKTGLVEYENLSAAAVDRLYADARAIATPEFDINSVLAVARDLRSGVQAKGKEKMVNSGVLDANGNMIQKAVTENIDLQSLSPIIQREVEKLEALDPKLPPATLENGKVATATDQLRAIRQNLWNIKTLDALGMATPEERRAAAQADKLYGAITHALKNPKNADASFAAAWQRANVEAAKRFDTLENLMVIQAAKTDTPAALAANLVKPNNFEKISALKAAMTPEHWRDFQQGVKTYLLQPEKLDNLSKTLDRLDQKTLYSIFDPKDVIDLSKVAIEVDNLNRIGIKKVLEKQSNVQAAIRDLTNRDDTKGIDLLVSQFDNKPPGDPGRRLVRAGVMQNVFDNSVEITQGGMQVNTKRLAVEVQRLQSSTLWTKLLSAEDRRVLGAFEKINPFLKTVEDSGTSLAAGNVASNVRQELGSFITGSDSGFNGFRALVEAISMGRLLTGPIGQRLVAGKGNIKPKAFESLRLIGALLGRESQDLRSEVSGDQ